MSRVFLVLFTLIVSLLLFINKAFADSLVLQDDGKVLFVTDSGIITKYLFSQEKYGRRVLGASSGVIITITASPFLPTDTPKPTATPTLTPTPTPVGTHSTPTSTPTPTPTPTPAGALLATITTPSSTTQTTVSKVVQNTNSKEPIIITPATKSGEMTISQGDAKATTALPLQLNTQAKTLNTIIKGVAYKVVSPAVILDTIQKTGTYMIPSTIAMRLVVENNQPVYQLKGQQHVQILGKFVIDLPLAIDVSASDGFTKKEHNSLLVSLIEFLHIGKRIIG